MTNLINTEIPLKVFLLEDNVKDLELLNRLKKDIDIYINEKNINYKTNVRGKMTDFNAFNYNKNFLNFCDLIQHNIKKIITIDSKLINSWGTILNGCDYTQAHTHTDTTSFSGILYLTEEGPGTYFEELNLTIKETIGKYVLFHPLLKHEVKPYVYTNKRYTIAFNFNEIKSWE
jgi:hypothetical protein